MPRSVVEIEERFWSMVNWDAHDPDRCWPWTKEEEWRVATNERARVNYRRRIERCVEEGLG